MEFRGRQLTALGFMVLVAGFLFVWGMFYLLGNPILAGGTTVLVSMEHGAGLKRGDRVLMNGVTVGSVRDVELARNGGVVAQVRLDAGVELPADSRALIRGDVFGAHTMDLVPGTALVMLQRGDTIAGYASPEIFDVLSDLGGRATAVLGNADNLLSPEVAADLHETVSVLPESARELQGAMAELRETAASLRRTAGLVEQADPGESLTRIMTELESGTQALTDAAESMGRSMDALEQALLTMTSILAKIDGGEGTLGRLVNDSSLYSEVEATLREVRQLATDIREQPGRFIDLRIF
ncbi:MAG TPA: MlaD family protein [Longimicrobiales bacterium]|nr:MlaD family protein [Longimicrobiales bacterium]